MLSMILYYRNILFSYPFYQLQQTAALVAQSLEAGVLGAEHVAVAVADEVGLGAVDVEAGAGGVDAAGGGLAAAAGFAVCGKLCLGVMRAVVEGVEVGAGFLELAVHPVVDAPDVALGVVAAGDTGLVRHEDGEVAAVVDIADGLLGSGDPDEVLGAMEVVDVDVECAVAVEEDGLSGNLIHRFVVLLPHRGRLFICHTHSNRRYRGRSHIP